MENCLIDKVVETCRKAGRYLTDIHRTTATRLKGTNDLVTTADCGSEEMLVASLRKLLPEASLLTEEAGQLNGTLIEDKNLFWVIDPLDGTVNYSFQIPFFCVSVALFCEGEPVLGVVYAPALQELYTAQKGEGAFLNGERLDLLIRHHPISHGEILVDGINLMDIEAKSWNRLVGVVEQSPYIFQGSIRDNIRFGKLDATEDEIIDAAKAAYAHDFILQMPRGYDSAVGNQGIELSGGQKQRLALARAIIKNPEILILDEATSALDSESEQKIQKAMENLGRNKTIITVAHRLSTIIHADKIFFIENGRIVEEGNHESLLELRGRYKVYFDLQWSNHEKDAAIV